LIQKAYRTFGRPESSLFRYLKSTINRFCTYYLAPSFNQQEEMNMSLKLFHLKNTAAIFLVVFSLCSVKSAAGQTFSSGSTGADGALNITAAGVTNFDPKVMGNPAVHTDGNAIYNFTTINISAASTLKLSGKLINEPVFLLASGTVEIDGTIDLNGENGQEPLSITNLASRVPAAPGSGGFPGGVGGICTPGSAGCGVTINLPMAQPGNGPDGGAASGPTTYQGVAGTFSGTQFLIPLVGGSGGGGHNSNDPATLYCGGGAGGGALAIASSISITMPGGARITANGGQGGCPGSGYQGGGSGSGGGVRLMAPVITAKSCGFACSPTDYAAVTVVGGPGGPATQAGGQGQIRFEAFQINGEGNSSGTISTSLPVTIPLPTSSALIKVISVAGIAINANPFVFPDASIASNVPVPLVIQAQSVPLTASVTLYIYSEVGADQAITVPALQGTLQQSTSTVNITFPQGGSRGYVKATWTQ
jgi:hypothetical protein